MRLGACQDGRTSIQKPVVLDSTSIGIPRITFKPSRLANSEDKVTFSIFFDTTSKCLYIRQRTQYGDVDVYSGSEQHLARTNLISLLLLAAREGLTNWKPRESVEPSPDSRAPIETTRSLGHGLFCSPGS